jgi:hypothetical protein
MIQRFHAKVDVIFGLFNGESCSVVFSWKETPSSEPIDQGRGVPPGNVYALACAPFFLPRYSDSVRGVLTADTKQVRYMLRTNLFESNQAHSGDSVTVLKFRTKWRW